MPTIIEIPEVGHVEFPDSMSEQDITTAAAKLHSEHTKGSAEPLVQYSGILSPLVSEKKGRELSSRIIGSEQQPLQRSSVPFVGDFIDAAKALPDVARGLINEPAATLRGFAGGAVEGLASQTDPVSLATVAIPAATRIMKGGKAARAAVAAANDLKPLIGTEQYADVLAHSVKGQLRDVSRFGKAPVIPELNPTARVAKSAVTEAAPAIERRVIPRTADAADDHLYETFRQKIAQGQPTGSPALRAGAEQKSALDATRAVRSPAPELLSNVDRLPGTRVVGKNILRPNQSTFDLAQEAMPSGVRLKALKKIPMPSGDTEIAKALRQRGHIESALQKSAKPKMAGSEAGFITTGAAALPLQALGQLRTASMLSGMALPMSIAGDIGAPITAALEAGSSKPIKELLRLPTNARNVVKAWKAGSNPAEISTYGAKKLGLNLPGRAIGAMDSATQQLLERAGVTPKEAQRILLQSPNKISAGIRDADPHGIVFPFTKTPSNFFSEGVKSFDLKNAGLRKAAITAGVTGAGFETGRQTDNSNVIRTGAAMAGPRGLPFTLAAGLGALSKRGRGSASKAVGSVSPIQDMSVTQFATNPLEATKRAVGLKPAFMHFTEQRDPSRVRLRRSRSRRGE